MAEGSRIPESLRRRIALYDEAIELRNLGLSYLEIGKRLGIGKNTVGLWMRGGKPKRVHRYEPDLSPSAELAYLTGFYLGDGKYAGKEHKVRFELADCEQLEHVGSLVAKMLGRAPKPYGRDGEFYTVDYDSVALSEFLNQDTELLLVYLKDFGRYFVRGFFDAEGYASPAIDFTSKKIASIVVGAANTNLENLGVIEGILPHLGIKWNIRRTNKRGSKMTIRGKTWVRKHDVYHLVVQGFPEASRFQELVGFSNKIKAEKLNDLILLQDMAPEDRYTWFVANYRKRGRRWVKIKKQSYSTSRGSESPAPCGGFEPTTLR